MSAPPPTGGQPYAPPYQGPVYYPPMNVENLLRKRMIWAANVFGLLLIYVGFLVGLAGVVVAFGLADFLVISGGLLGAFGSLSGALASKRTTDMQNLGLFVWAGLLLWFTAFLAGTV